MTRRLLLFFLVLFALLLPCLSDAYSIKYDLSFKRWGQYYFPWDDWKHWKAQGLAESGLNPHALSYCGAIGLMQLMPVTAKVLGVNPYDIEGNIQGGVKYDRQMHNYWTMLIDPNRRDFTFASYNAGLGNIIKARKLSGSNEWGDVASCLDRITGKSNAKQTTDYVIHIKKFYTQI